MCSEHSAARIVSLSLPTHHDALKVRARVRTLRLTARSTRSQTARHVQKSHANDAPWSHTHTTAAPNLTLKFPRALWLCAGLGGRGPACLVASCFPVTGPCPSPTAQEVGCTPSLIAQPAQPESSCPYWIWEVCLWGVRHREGRAGQGEKRGRRQGGRWGCVGVFSSVPVVGGVRCSVWEVSRRATFNDGSMSQDAHTPSHRTAYRTPPTAHAQRADCTAHLSRTQRNSHAEQRPIADPKNRELHQALPAGHSQTIARPTATVSVHGQISNSERPGDRHRWHPTHVHPRH